MAVTSAQDPEKAKQDEAKMKEEQEKIKQDEAKMLEGQAAPQPDQAKQQQDQMVLKKTKNSNNRISSGFVFQTFSG